jgi:hypothetical protein
MLQLEGLEDRLALSTASLTGSPLPITVAQPSQQITSTANNYNATKVVALNAATPSHGTTQTNVHEMATFKSAIHDDPFFFDSSAFSVG